MCTITCLTVSRVIPAFLCSLIRQAAEKSQIILTEDKMNTISLVEHVVGRVRHKEPP